MTTTLAVVVGSPRAASIHRRLADVAAAVAPQDVDVQIIDGLDALPFYNEDLDIAPAPSSVQRLRNRLSGADAVLLLSPANNGTLSAVLKNAIDWASRPYGESSLSGKPVAVASAAHNTSTVVDHTHLAVTIAGGRPLPEASSTFALGELADVDVSAHTPINDSLRATVQALIDAVGKPVAA
ncbi:NAD(P)H-dependent oxidoreductase [Calidifontibacter sp. DB0510]|uniref:NAD(P)H-dependent oxidoreductase n=1 Tax=Metallococcus carri TaxID=1656884 RepID=A0A967EDX8_9MICO|nr:NAD(P)H-dependent oxidoreductase [Metallococcus carri]NHN55141.1 NAD(P)H-dependent oxidoreductase [Metallococcus carri]NOP36218.1 NAD(P)H-dependent oxidoreductase [Calidifontibacter sp. DB2511S]